MILCKKKKKILCPFQMKYMQIAPATALIVFHSIFGLCACLKDLVFFPSSLNICYYFCLVPMSHGFKKLGSLILLLSEANLC